MLDKVLVISDRVQINFKGEGGGGGMRCKERGVKPRSTSHFPIGTNRGPFLESPDNFSGPESYFVRPRFTLKIHILLVFKAKQ